MKNLNRHGSGALKHNKIIRAIASQLASKPQEGDPQETLQKINAQLQSAALMVGIASNILLDNLSTLSAYEVVWAKDLKYYGNQFVKKLENAEQKIWNHVGEHSQSFFQLASLLEQTLQTICTMDYDKLIQLIAAV